ncbi:MAG TPA: caspase family protein [Chitinophagaceae bacterium]|nr:caspase family protein [Chitinophagaceae bacterium]
MQNVFRFCLMLIFFGLAKTVLAQDKYALIIGIGKYKFWEKISSDNDVPFIKAALIKQGFAEANISILMDERATISGINQSFKNLVKRVKSGDVVFVHVSSHGEQIEDNNKDEVDGLDEAIVSYDAPKPGSTSNYAKEQHYYFRDDQFGIYLNQLRTKLGQKGDVVVFLDACHSGSGVRGLHKVRGNQPPLVSANFKKPETLNAVSSGVFADAEKNSLNKALASYVLVSGSLAEERNTESVYPDGKEGGSLSIALTKVLEKLKPGTTYRSLYSDIVVDLNEMVPDQHPVIEGNGIDRELFGGKYVSQQPYFEIASIDNTDLILKGGSLMGLDSGAKVSLYIAGTKNTDQSDTLATGTIVAAEPFRSLVKLNKIPDLRAPAAGWIFLTEPVYNLKPVSIGFTKQAENGATRFSNVEIKNYQLIIKEISQAEMNDVPELLIAKGSTQDSLILASNGFVFGLFNAGDGKELKKIFQRYCQYKFLQQLALKSSLVNLDVKLLPTINGKIVKQNNDKKNDKGILTCRVGDALVVQAKNNGDEPIYLNILDLQPDGIINPIFPNTNTSPIITPEELKIEPGEEKTFSKFVITIGKPTGLEIFKIFASLSKIDMERIAQRTITSKGNFSTLEKLIDQTYDISNRSAIAPGKPEGSVFNIPFRIIDKNGN